MSKIILNICDKTKPLPDCCSFRLFTYVSVRIELFRTSTLAMSQAKAFFNLNNNFNFMFDRKECDR